MEYRSTHRHRTTTWMLISPQSIPFKFAAPLGMTATVFLPDFFDGLPDRLSLPSSPLLNAIEELDIADGGRGGILLGGGIASEAEDTARLIPGGFEIVGRRDMLNRGYLVSTDLRTEGS